MSSLSSAAGSTTVTATVALTTIKDQIDNAVGPLLDASVHTINGSAGAFLQIVAALGHACTKIRIADTTGQFIGVYTGAGGSEALAFIINPGVDDYLEYTIAQNIRVSVRAMGSGSITTGNLILQFAS